MEDIPMEIQSLRLVCFSPTKTSKTIIQEIARGINHPTAELMDITRPDARKQQLQTSEDELLVIAVPVYCGRVPAPVAEWLRSLKAHDTPAVCVVVYGNRAFDDALLELKDIMTQQGCRPVACAAFIGEHSFSDSETPLAAGRPDAGDLDHAEQFGRKIQEKLHSVSSSDRISEITVPGNHPYRDPGFFEPVDFIAVSEKCSHCGVCEEGCPSGAIDLENDVPCDKNKCFVCCACIKACPEKARTIIPGIVKDIAGNLYNMCKERKEPVFFL
jgi:ferredoxin